MAVWSFRKCFRALLLTALVLFGFGCTTTPSASSLQNSDFEQNVGGAPAGWFLSDAAKAKGEAIVVARAGNQLRLTPNAKNTGGNDPLGVGQALDAGAYHGQRLQLSARMAAEGGAAAVVGLVALDGSGAPIESLMLREDGAAAGGLAHSQTSVTDPLPNTAKTLILFASVEGTSGRAFFDDIEILGNAGAVAAASAAPAGAIAPTVLTIRPKTVLAPVDPGIFGTNVEWIRNANDLWDSARGGLDPEILALGRQAGIRGIRFPGGVWSDAYTWTDGIGPVAQRKATPHVPGDKETSRHVIGTDEIAKVARDFGAKLILTVNVGNGTPKMAAAWAAYVRDKHGSGLVSFWEIGNELYMKGDLSGAHMDPETYARNVLDFAAAIRSEIPDAKIAAIGLVNRGRYDFNAHRDWNEVVLQRTAAVIDYYAVHNAYAPIVVAEKMRDGAQVYRSMFAASELIADNMRKTRSIMDKAGAQDAEIVVTEWGPMFSIDPKNPYFDHVKTLGSGVFVARALNVFLRDPNVRSAQFFKLSDVLNSGWIGRDGRGGHRATPALQAFGLYANGVQGTVVAVDRSGPTFRVRSTGYVGTVEDAPVVDALASVKGSTITVTLSSAELQQKAPVTLSVAGKDGASYTLETKTLSGVAPDAHNGTRMIEVPGLKFASPQGFSGRGAFENPKPSDVTLTQSASQSITLPYQFDIPPHSVVQLRLIPRG